jgi:hypothetical protein
MVFLGVTSEVFDFIWNALPLEDRHYWDERGEKTHGKRNVQVGSTVIWDDYLLSAKS